MSKKFFLALSPFVFVFSLSLLFSTLSTRKTQVASIVNDYSGYPQNNLKEGIYHRNKIKVPEISTKRVSHPVLGVSNSQEKWIEVDLSDQHLKAWDGNSLFLETLVSTGLPWWPTPTGEFRIWVKLRATKMEGGEGAYYYNLPNVPYVMFFENSEVPGWRGYGLHGTYWHNDFGRVHSHGCVNLPTPVAEKLYYWTTPVMPEGRFTTFSSPENPGTRIIIHK